ncbi:MULTISPECIES: FkbM family methyltransferase [Methylomonas]|uniref:FkbM family methyltransferase n=1 Tax=Methylomonas TaxID=416 RepID=UPI001232AEC8|nr:FkbM family methyltransferase [Methylomonas rhizoryzae]
MGISIPKPSKLNVLARIYNAIPVTSIVDVGVRECTGELIQCFPSKKHYLFEPVSLFFKDIERNYSNINYQLFPIALSNESSQIYLILTSLHKDGKVTHSKISTQSVSIDGKDVVDCLPIDVKRFDALALTSTIDPNFLLKVDVDGQDLNVIKGFGSKLSLASVVIIECTYLSAIERMGYLQSNGFQLIDIVDIVYYGQSLYQFDAVFVRKDMITVDLCPSISAFKRELWQPLQF